MNSKIEITQNNSEQAIQDLLGGSKTTASGQGDAFLNVFDGFIQLVRENRWLIIVFILVGAIAGTLKAISETPVYQARLTMAVEPSSYSPSSQSVFDPFAFRFYETQYELLKSRSVAERVVQRLGLVENRDVHQLLVRPTFVSSVIAEFNALTGRSNDIEKKSRESNQIVKQAPLSEGEKQRKKTWLTNVIQQGVSVSGGEKTNLVQVTFKSVNPQFAAQIANALVEAYIEQGLDSQLNRSQQTSKWLSQKIEDLKITLDDAQTNLQSFLVNEGMLDSSRSSQITTAELQVLNQEFLGARANYDELSKRYGDRHPKITEARAELNAAKSRLDRRSKLVASSREKEVELSRLERDVEVNQELYEAFLAKFKEADLSSSGSKVASARIIDRALAPSLPIYPQKQKIIFIWTLGGFLFALGFVFLREQLDSTFNNARAIEEKLGLPLYGVVEKLNLKDGVVERAYIENTRSVFSESINHIRTGLMYSDVDNSPKVMVVTSSVQGEGKTTVASNLALSYSQMGNTLLIDADLRRPRIKHIIDTDSKFGLVDCVAGVIELSKCIKQDLQTEQLYILKSGTTPPNPLELLSSVKFKKIIEELKSKFDYIIIDTAPVLPASDAVALGQFCDALLMVVQSEKTTHHMVRDSIKRLNASHVDVTGLILTQVDIKKENPYRYGGYYGYGAYSYTQDK